MKAYMEHVNLTVSDLENSVKFFKTAFPEFEIRGGGESDFGKWIHFGSDESYLAITEDKSHENTGELYQGTGINHVGFVVEDVDSVAKRLLAEGFSRNYPKQIQEYRIRDYFADKDGNQFEFVQYLSEVWDERNSYHD